MNYQERLSKLFNAPVGGVGTLLLYTHHDWGTSYVLRYKGTPDLGYELIIRAKTLCQMGIHSMLDQSVCGCE